MKAHKLLFLLALTGTICIFQSCTRTSSDVWEDTKSAGRHVQKGVRALGGKQGDSRQIRARSDFESIEDEDLYQGGSFQDYDYDQGQENGYSYAQPEFIPLEDQVNYRADVGMADMIAPQPRETPGEPGSSIPGIEYFRDPSTNPQLAGIFKNIYFEYNSNLIKGPENLQIIHNVADFMRRHPNFYLFIEGHADERGPQAYNLALGSRRANAVRNALIGAGANPDHLFTISYGKERPLVLEHHEEAWSKNRRAEFKVYER